MRVDNEMMIFYTFALTKFKKIVKIIRVHHIKIYININFLIYDAYFIFNLRTVLCM